jgi:hypothetical protein
MRATITVTKYNKMSQKGKREHKDKINKNEKKNKIKENEKC